MKTYFIMTDIHSFFEPMQKALSDNNFDINNKDHILLICGDLFDRGDDSVKVFNFVKDLAEQDRLVYVRGNHEDLLEDCLNEIYHGYFVSNHHYSNKTVKTICDFCQYRAEWKLSPGYANITDIRDCMQPVVDFIDKYSVDYYELGDKIFVHGWIPTVDYKTAQPFEWKEARWLNGMQMWKSGVKLAEKTIYCGHWHCSFGNSHYHLDKHLKEFPQVNRDNWQESFQPFVDDGIVALDACTAYSGICNCIKLEVN